ncbi:Cdc6/Cdc18 family protein [Halorhabdus amylolytica]|uniref:Cdc6/Cdc18 family protein n=1 Tax=Halorhabdus amylolytica TaxID=2559573 RepID=UPI0010AAF777|nr:Cdc6/Cdc18 family protein [Halorhabdus amylolytica]
MITDARALRPEFVPQDLHHRDGQIDHLSSILDPVTYGERAEDICIYGPSGSGKTTIAKFVLRLLEAETLGVRWGYVNCMGDTSGAAVLYELARELGLGADLRREGFYSGVALDRIRESDDQIIAVLDEVDVLDDSQTLLSLYEIPNLSIITITIDESDWLAELDPRAESRFQSAESVHLESYSFTELVDILESRVEHGLISSRVDDSAIERIADLAAGDARHGIALLRRAARHVEEQDMRSLTPAVVDAIVDEAEMDMRERRVRSLGTHQRILFEIIESAGEIKSGELHEEYEREAQHPKAKSTRRKYLASLQRYGLIESEGFGRGTVYCATSTTA